MRQALLLMLASALTAPAAAQIALPPTPTPPPPSPPVVAPLPAPSTALPAGPAVPADTEVKLLTERDISSKKLRVGDTFPLVVAEDVSLGGGVAIPRGTPAIGAVSWRTGKGTMGKSAKMEIEFRSLTWHGQPVALTGKDRQEGKGNTAATLGTLLLFGPLAAGVTGTSAIFRKGRVFSAHLAAPLPLGPATATP